jgi:hypothetical protein
MTDPGKEFPSLNHFGDGPQVVGDFNGNDIYEQLDARSRATLAKLSEDAPALASLLEEALRDGLISPGVIDDLRSALDDDVLHVLRMVGRNLSEEVVLDLRIAGENINKAVTEDFNVVNNALIARVHEINVATKSLRVLMEQADIHTDAASRTDRESFPPDLQSPDKWRVRFGLICCSSAVGLAAAMILIRVHHEGFAILAVAVMVVFAILLFGKGRP